MLEFDKSVDLKENAMLKVREDLFYEWDFEKNNKLGLNIYEVTKGSRVKVNWKCNLNHEWETKVSERNNNCGCPYCSSHRVWIGFNDIHSTNERLSKSILNHGDGYKYTQGSKVKLDWKCECGQIIRNKSPFIVNREGLGCPCKSKGISYPEKFMYYLLRELNIKFEWEKTFAWSDNKRYDFYLPEPLNIILEIHGGQHYNDSFQFIGGRTLKEEQLNDKYKYDLAMSNNIEKYIVIDSRYSNKEWMTNNIKLSELNNVFNLSDINWNDIHEKSLGDIKKEAITLWNEYKSINKICEIMMLDRRVIIPYLNLFEEFNIDEDVEKLENKKNKYIKDNLVIEIDIKTMETNEYIKDDVKTNKVTSINKKKSKYIFNKDYYNKNFEDIHKRINKVKDEKLNIKKIHQYNYNLELVKIWDVEYYEIAEQFKLSNRNLYSHLKRNQLSFADYIWCYEDDYSKMVKYFNKSFSNERSYLIYQFDLDGNLIRKWRNGNYKDTYNNIELNFKHIKKKVLDNNHYYKGYIFIRNYLYDKMKNKEEFWIKIKDRYNK